LIQLHKIIIQSLVTKTFFSPYKFFENNTKTFPNFFNSFLNYLLKNLNQYNSYHHYFVYLSLDTSGNKQQNLQRSIYHLRKSAKMGNHFSLCNLGFCYGTGYGVKQNMKKAITLYKHAATFNNSHALFNLGTCYKNGEGLEQDLIKAIHYYKRAAEFNHPTALYYLGVCYHKGEGVKHNLFKAVQYYKRAAEFDHIDAIFNLANCFFYGNGTNQNYKTAFELYQHIMKLTEDSQTYFKLFHLYSHGIGVRRNILQSIQFLIKSANLEYQTSFVQLDFILLNGNFIDKNKEEAISYFKKSSENYEIDGIFWYGFCLIKGKGIQKNIYLGRELIEISIEQEFLLAELYCSLIEEIKHNYN
jgi:TPR repeat protein